MLKILIQIEIQISKKFLENEFAKILDVRKNR